MNFLMLEKKTRGIIFGRTILGILSLGVLALPSIIGNKENNSYLGRPLSEKVIEVPSQSIDLKLYDVLPNFDASIEDLGKVINS